MPAEAEYSQSCRRQSVVVVVAVAVAMIVSVADLVYFLDVCSRVRRFLANPRVCNDVWLTPFFTVLTHAIVAAPNVVAELWVGAQASQVFVVLREGVVQVPWTLRCHANCAVAVHVVVARWRNLQGSQRDGQVGCPT